MGKVGWVDGVRNEGSKGKEYCAYNKKKVGGLDWSHLAWNWLLKHVIEGKIGTDGSYGRKRKKT
jgi:hypothetical protein